VTFETWTFKGVRFLAVPNGRDGVGIVNEHGEHFGGWYGVTSFRERQQRKDALVTPIGKAIVRMIATVSP
jgi:hypothetical protein